MKKNPFKNIFLNENNTIGHNCVPIILIYNVQCLTGLLKTAFFTPPIFLPFFCKPVNKPVRFGFSEPALSFFFFTSKKKTVQIQGLKWPSKNRFITYPQKYWITPKKYPCFWKDLADISLFRSFVSKKSKKCHFVPNKKNRRIECHPHVDRFCPEPIRKNRFFVRSGSVLAEPVFLPAFFEPVKNRFGSVFSNQRYRF